MADDDRANPVRDSKLARALAPPAAGERPAEAKITRLPAPGVDVALAAAALARWFENEGMQAQVLGTADGIVVQARSRNKLLRAVGASVALTMTLRTERADLVVETGPAKWGVKGAIGGLAIVTTTPFLALPAAWGTYNQMRLPKRAIGFLSTTMPSYQRGSAPAGGAPSPTAAPPPGAGGAARPAPVDPNTARPDELVALPGVDAPTAEEIVRRRFVDGPFRSGQDFAARMMDALPPAVMANILPSVSIGPVPEPRRAPPTDQGRSFG